MTKMAEQDTAEIFYRLLSAANFFRNRVDVGRLDPDDYREAKRHLEAIRRAEKTTI